jgi:predicted nucleic acid-binding protein
MTGLLRRRKDEDLTFVDDAPLLGPPLLLDTCVYVDGLEGALPPAAEDLLRTRTLIHLSLVVGELSHNFGRLDPRHPNTKAHLDALSGVIADIPPHRLEDAIGAGVLLEAGMLSGLVFRLGGFQPGQEVAALVDATLYRHALERGYTVLTRNLRDFDFLNQIVPAGRVLFYRAM